MVIWIIGLSGSGKTYLSKKLKKKLGKNFIQLDGDVIRETFGHDLGHSINDRRINAMRISRLAHFLSKNGVNLIVSVLSLFPKWLKWNKKNIKNYFEIFIDVPIGVLVKRNSKRVYKKNNKLNKNIVGINIKFKNPKNSDLVLSNKFTRKDIDENLKIIIKSLKNKKLIKRSASQID